MKYKPKNMFTRLVIVDPGWWHVPITGIVALLVFLWLGMTIDNMLFLLALWIVFCVPLLLFGFIMRRIDTSRYRRMMEEAARRGDKHWWKELPRYEIPTYLSSLGIEYPELAKRALAEIKTNRCDKMDKAKLFITLTNQYIEEALNERGLLRPAASDSRGELLQPAQSTEPTSDPAALLRASEGNKEPLQPDSATSSLADAKNRVENLSSQNSAVQ